jgi:hypothetical protein
MRKSIALFAFAIAIVSVYASQATQVISANTAETITTAKRILKLETELLKNSNFFPISYAESLIAMNKENLALVKNDLIQHNLILLDDDLKEALEAIKELKDNNTGTPRPRTKLLSALQKANTELTIIDDMLHVPSV